MYLCNIVITHLSLSQLLGLNACTIIDLTSRSFPLSWDYCSSLFDFLKIYIGWSIISQITLRIWQAPCRKADIRIYPYTIPHNLGILLGQIDTYIKCSIIFKSVCFIYKLQELYTEVVYVVTCIQTTLNIGRMHPCIHTVSTCHHMGLLLQTYTFNFSV